VAFHGVEDSFRVGVAQGFKVRKHRFLQGGFGILNEGFGVCYRGVRHMISLGIKDSIQSDKSGRK
jgi:hypothetical protein